MVMKHFNIQAPAKAILPDLKQKIDNKTKPLGALGQLEEIVLQIGLIQNTAEPHLQKPAIVVFAGDHGIAAEGEVNPYPQEVTAQMVYNFLNGGAAINVFSRQHNIHLQIVDAGVNHDFEEHPRLISAKIAKGTRNYRYEPAMREEECAEAIKKGAAIVRQIFYNGSNVIGFGEVGIGNTSSATLIMSAITGISIGECVGNGTGLDREGVRLKQRILEEVMDKHKETRDPLQVLSILGGYEIAMICGGILQAAELKMTILIDGFIVSSALLIAAKLYPDVLDYCLFTHVSGENGHPELLHYLKVTPILNLNMRLGEGTGAAVAFPIVQSAVAFLNKMASFEGAGVSGKSVPDLAEK